MNFATRWKVKTQKRHITDYTNPSTQQNKNDSLSAKRNFQFPLSPPIQTHRTWVQVESSNIIPKKKTPLEYLRGCQISKMWRHIKIETINSIFFFFHKLFWRSKLFLRRYRLTFVHNNDRLILKLIRKSKLLSVTCVVRDWLNNFTFFEIRKMKINPIQ